MNTFLLKISSPDGDLFHGRAVSLTLRGAEGDLAVLAGHIPFVTTVKPGICRITQEDETVREGRAEGGVLSVTKEAVTLLSAGFRWEDPA